MKVYDQHVHTSLSHDSIEEMENYLKILVEKDINNFVSTEHLEISTINESFDLIPNFQLQQQKIKDLGEKYKINIFMGVEVGYRKSSQDKIAKIVDDTNFDVVLLAIHNDEEVDIGSAEFQGNGKLTEDEIYDKYLQLCLNAVTNYKNFDVFAHIDFMIRYMKPNVTISKHKEKLEKIFNILVEDEKTLEFNTRFLYKNKTTQYLEEIFDIYKNCGGEYISLGSDCHSTTDFYGGFLEAIDMMKRKGFKTVRYFQNRKPIDVEI